MTVRKRSRIWTQQPQVAVAVSHKFGKPAAAAIHTSIAAPDLVGRREATLYGGTYPPESIVGPAGKGLKAVSGGNSIVPAYSIPEITGDYTLICVASIPSTGTWALIDTDAYPSTRHLQFRVESSNAIGAIPFDTGGNPVFPVSAGSVSHGVPFVAAVRLSGSDCDVWLGGTGGTKATLSGSPQHAHGLFSIGGSQSGNLDDCLGGGATIYSWVAFPSAISDAALRELTKSVSAYWQIFAPRSSRRLISSGGGSSTSLTVQDAQHGHLADSLSFSLDTYLAVTESLHAHTADNVTLTTTGTANLVVQEAAHAHTADGVVLTTQWLLAVAEALHSHAADNVALSLQTALSVLEALHGHSADNLTLGVTGATNLVIADATSGHAADNLAFSLNTLLAVFDAIHAHAADALTLDTSNATALTVQDSMHGHGADSLTLSLDTWLAIVEAAHGHTADSPTLSADTSLQIAEALHAHYADVVVLGFPSAPGSCPTVEEIVAAVLAALNATTIPVDTRKMNGAVILGDGSAGNKWRGNV